MSLTGQRLFADGIPDVPKPETWVAFGDSIVEGMTYPLWLSQSLAAAGKPTPEWINAGVGGNTSGQMLARFERDVLAYHPQRVFFNCGVNDLHQGKEGDIAANLDIMLGKLKALGITGCVNSTAGLAGDHFPLNEKLKPINAVLREKAEKYGFQFANVFDPFMAALNAGKVVNEPDHEHLNEDGYAIYTAAVLKAVAPGVPLSLPWAPVPERGILPEWKVSTTENPAESWTVHVPDPTPVDFWWKNQERKRGFVLNLKDHSPNAKAFMAQGTLHLPASTAVLLKVGGQVTSLSLDGKSLPLYPTNHTWGIREGARTGVLPAGDHTIEIKTTDGDTFFVAALPIA